MKKMLMTMVLFCACTTTTPNSGGDYAPSQAEDEIDAVDAPAVDAGVIENTETPNPMADAGTTEVDAGISPEPSNLCDALGYCRSGWYLNDEGECKCKCHRPVDKDPNDDVGQDCND